MDVLFLLVCLLICFPFWRYTFLTNKFISEVKDKHSDVWKELDSPDYLFEYINLLSMKSMKGKKASQARENITYLIERFKKESRTARKLNFYHNVIWKKPVLTIASFLFIIIAIFLILDQS
jgi:hypothetical protein